MAELPAGAAERYQIRRRLGAGGFGTVYEALDKRHNAAIALKVLRSAEGDDLYRFKQEFRALREITHPNLITLYELSSDEGVWFFSMELVQGTDVLSYLRGHRAGSVAASSAGDMSPTVRSMDGPVPEPQQEQRQNVDSGSYERTVSVERLVPVLVQLGQGLMALHAAGKVHRDIKPGNVLCTWEGRVVLLDFGLARDSEGNVSSGTGPLMGTPDYIAPEQAEWLPAGPAADWYGFGVLLYEAVTGRLPFTGTTLQVLRQKLTRKAPAPRNREVPTELLALCSQLLARDPAQRPSGEQVLARLRGLGAAASAGPAVPLPVPRPRTPFIGRASQLAALHDAYKLTRQARAVVVGCHGESGSGKSTLCRRFLHELSESERQAVVLSGRCYEHEDVPFKTLDGVIDALSRALRRHLRDETAALLPRDVAALARVFPVLLQVPAIQAAPARRIADEELVRQAAFAALRELLLRLTDRHPVVLYIDDLQWGDLDGTRLLLQLLRPPEPPPLMLLCSYRSEERAASGALLLLEQQAGTELAEAVVFREVAVGELSVQEAEALALSHLAVPDPARAASIAVEARRNPFFVTELSRFLASADPPPGVGADLDKLLVARVAQLPENARRLAEAVAVAGQPIARTTAARAAFEHAAAANEPGALALLLSQRLLRVRHALRRGEDKPHEELVPYHDRIRAAVVKTLPTVALTACHLRLGHALLASEPTEPERLVYHFKCGGDTARVARYALQASEEAQRALSHHQVERMCRAALETGLLSAADTHAVNVRLADALAVLGRPREAGAAYLALAAREAGAHALQRRRQAARQLISGGYLDEGMAVLRQILAAVKLSLPRSTLHIVAVGLWYRLLLWLRGHRFRERPAAQCAAIDLLRVDTCEVVSSIASTNPVLFGYFLLKGLWLALDTGEPLRIALALCGEVLMHSGLGVPLAKIRPTLELARALSERVGDANARGRVRFVEGTALHLAGRWRQSSLLLEQAEEILRRDCAEAAPQLDHITALGLYNLRYLGDLCALAEKVPKVLKEAMAQGKLSHEAIVRMIAGFMLPLRDDAPALAEQFLQAAEARFAGQRFNLQHLFALDARLMILLYQGRAAEAWQLLQQNRRDMARCGQLNIKFFSVMFRNLRGLLALAAGQPWRIAAAQARVLQRVRLRFAPPMAALLRALVLRCRGQQAAALLQLTVAEQGFTQAEMALHAACVRLRRGEWLGGDAGARLGESARAWMAEQGVRSPERMAAMLAPVPAAAPAAPPSAGVSARRHGACFSPE